jgi:hypothetical protein
MFPVTGEYQADEMDPLITVFPDSTGKASIERLNDLINVKMPSGRKVSFVFRNNQWELEWLKE